MVIFGHSFSACSSQLPICIQLLLQCLGVPTFPESAKSSWLVEVVLREMCVVVVDLGVGTGVCPGTGQAAEVGRLERRALQASHHYLPVWREGCWEKAPGAF